MKTPDTDKLVQALLDNEARYTMPDEERERVTREAKELWEAAQKPIPLQVINPSVISWRPIRELTQVQADEDAKVHAALDAVAANVGAASIRETEDARILEAMKEVKP